MRDFKFRYRTVGRFIEVFAHVEGAEIPSRVGVARVTKGGFKDIFDNRQYKRLRPMARIMLRSRLKFLNRYSLKAKPVMEALACSVLGLDKGGKTKNPAQSVNEGDKSTWTAEDREIDRIFSHLGNDPDPGFLIARKKKPAEQGGDANV